MDRRRPGVQVEDDAFIALTHAAGVRSELWVSAVAAHLGPRLRVLGSEGAYVVQGLDGQEDALRAGGDPASADWGKESPGRWGRLVVGDSDRAVARGPGAYPQFYKGVRDAIGLAGPVPVNPGDAVMTLRILDAARRSAPARRGGQALKRSAGLLLWRKGESEVARGAARPSWRTALRPQGRRPLVDPERRGRAGRGRVGWPPGASSARSSASRSRTARLSRSARCSRAARRST